MVVHERLMRRLRRKASRNGLSDAEILDEMVLYATAKDDGCGGKCLCGKRGLKFLYFMHNKGPYIKDVHKIFTMFDPLVRIW